MEKRKKKKEMLCANTKTNTCTWNLVRNTCLEIVSIFQSGICMPHKGKLQFGWIQLKMETRATLKFKLSMQGLVASILVCANYTLIFFLPKNTNCTHNNT
jgi:hypothetical protein